MSNRRHKNVGKVALNRLKRHLFEVGELKQEGRMSPCSTSAGNTHRAPHTSHHPEHILSGRCRAASLASGATGFGRRQIPEYGI